MKVAGHETFSTVETLTLAVVDGQAIKVRVAPMRLPFRSELVRRLPDPVAPVESVRDEHGKLLRYPGNGPEAGRPVIAPNQQNADYRARAVRNETLQALAIFHEGTRAHGDIEWGVSEPEDTADRKEWHTFYESLLTEVEAAKLPLGAIMHACKRISALSGFNTQQLDDLADRFSEGGTEA